MLGARVLPHLWVRPQPAKVSEEDDHSTRWRWNFSVLVNTTKTNMSALNRVVGRTISLDPEGDHRCQSLLHAASCVAIVRRVSPDYCDAGRSPRAGSKGSIATVRTQSGHADANACNHSSVSISLVGFNIPHSSPEFHVGLQIRGRVQQRRSIFRESFQYESLVG